MRAEIGFICLITKTMSYLSNWIRLRCTFVFIKVANENNQCKKKILNRFSGRT